MKNRKDVFKLYKSIDNESDDVVNGAIDNLENLGWTYQHMYNLGIYGLEVKREHDLQCTSK